MKYTTFGQTELKVSTVGFGCLQLSFPAPLSDALAVDIIVEAYRQGVTFFDTAAAYGINRHSEKLLGKALQYMDKSQVIIASKCGIDFGTMEFTQSPAEIRASVQLSLETLGLECLDVLYLHRIDPDATAKQFEATIKTMKSLVLEGKVKYIGLSEPSAAQIRTAHLIEPSTVPITSVESAYSIVTRRCEANGVLATCRELGIAFVAYSSLARGLCDTRLQNISESEIDHLSAEELQQRVLQVLAIPQNNLAQKEVGLLSTRCIKKNISTMLEFQNAAMLAEHSPAELALAWLQHQKVLPIPGTTVKEFLLSNNNSSDLKITPAELDKLSEQFPLGSFSGSPNPVGLSKFDNETDIEPNSELELEHDHTLTA